MNWDIPAQVKPKTGILEFKTKGGLFASWITVFAKIEGRWLSLYKKEGSLAKVGAIELGQGVQMKSFEDLENFARRFDVVCKGGGLPPIEWNFRVSGRKDRDGWVRAILANVNIYTQLEIEAFPRYRDYEEIVTEMIHGVPTAVRLIPKSNNLIRKNNQPVRAPLHAKSFLGYDAVTFLVSNKYAESHEDAEALCQLLLSMNLIHHLVWAQDFSMGEVFCFTQDQNVNTCVQVFETLIEVGKFWIYLPVPLAAESSSVFSSPQKEAMLPQAMLTSRSIANLSSTNRHASVLSRSLSSHSSSEASKDTSSSIEILDESKWVNADTAKYCFVCEKGFNPLRRKHHCRLCGSVVCTSCGIHTTVGQINRAVNVRVCLRCRVRMKQSQEASRNASALSEGSQHRLSITSHTTHLSDTTTSTAHCSVCNDCDNRCQPQTTASVEFPLDFGWANSWPKPPRRLNENLCVETLDQTKVLMQPDPWFDQLCDVLVSNTNCEKAVIGFMTTSHFVLMGTSGPIDMEKAVPFEVAFAPHAIMSAEPLVCCDVGEDVRFAHNLYMRKQWRVGFYASYPILVSTGLILGAIEVYHPNPRRQCHNVQVHLEEVAQLVVQYLDDLIEQSKRGSAPVSQPEPIQAPAAQATNPPPAPGFSSMEGTLMELLEKTTGTQSQLQQQQVQMVHAVGNHSQQINMLAEKLQRIEAAIDKRQATTDES
ncbi:hypothetical protein AC1031_012608 [Aphanomyces cochlioides]|nr:hypothetical protein AC1031_012608 [Aphanomyces cochlioides]